MKEHFLKSGFNGFEPEQIIEMLLFYAYPRKDTKAQARVLLERFGNLEGVFNANAGELASVPGIGDGAAVLLGMIRECAAICFSSRSERVTYNDTGKLKELFSPCFVGLKREKLFFACFDDDLRLICNNALPAGAAFANEKNVKKMVEIAIKSNAAATALAHNRPNGLAAASADDIQSTRIVSNVLKSMGIRLLDHIIAGADKTVSMRENADLTVFD
jgi:DNA repair protein RadC